MYVLLKRIHTCGDTVKVKYSTVKIRDKKLPEEEAIKSSLEMASDAQCGIFGDTGMDDGHYEVKFVHVFRNIILTDDEQKEKQEFLFQLVREIIHYPNKVRFSLEGLIQEYFQDEFERFYFGQITEKPMDMKSPEVISALIICREDMDSLIARHQNGFCNLTKDLNKE